MMASPENPNKTLEEVATQISVEEIPKKVLTIEVIKQSIEGGGLLGNLKETTLTYFGNSASGAITSEAADERILEILKEKNPNLADEINESAQYVKEAIARVQAIAVNERKKIEMEDDFDKGGKHEKLPQKTKKTSIKDFEQLLSQLKNTPLETPTESIVVSHIYPDLIDEKPVAPGKNGGEPIEFSHVSGLLKKLAGTIASKDFSGKKLIDTVDIWVEKLPMVGRKATLRHEGAIEIANAFRPMAMEIDKSLNELGSARGKFGKPIEGYYKLFGLVPIPLIRKGQVKLAGSGVSRVLEMITTVAETSSLSVAGAYMTQALFQMSETITRSNDWRLSVLVTAASLFAVALPAYLFKQRVEEEIIHAREQISILSKVFFNPIFKAAVKNPGKALAAVLSVHFMALGITNGTLSFERAQDLSTLIEQSRDNVEHELDQVTESQGGVNAAQDLFSKFATFVGLKGKPGESLSGHRILDDVLEVPDKLWHNFTLALLGETGDSSVRVAAGELGFPNSDTPGYGPRAQAIAGLMGFSPQEGESFTGQEATTIFPVTKEVLATRARVRAFATRHKLYLTDEEIENPRTVMNALVMQYRTDAYELFSKFASDRGGWTRVNEDSDSLTPLSALTHSLIYFEPAVDVQEFPARLRKLAAISKEISAHYNVNFADSINELGLIYGNGIRDIYNVNGEGRNIDPAKIAIAPPPLSLEFPDLNKLADEIEAATRYGDDVNVPVPKDIDLAEQEFDELLDGIQPNIDALLDVLNPFDETEEIVNRHYGPDSSKEEREHYIELELSKSYIVGFTAVFGIGLLLSWATAGGYLRRVEREFGDAEKDRVAAMEKKYLGEYTKIVNKNVQKFQTKASEFRKKGIDVVFPYEQVSEAEVKRALRAAGREGFVKMNHFEQAIARGPFLPTWDGSRKYGESLTALGNPKHTGAVLDQLFPGMSIAFLHMEKYGDKGKKIKSGIDNVYKDPRILELAILLSQNETDKADLELHKVLLDHIKEKTFGSEDFENTVELLPHIAKKLKKLKLYDREWAEIIFTAQGGTVLDELGDAVTLFQSKIKNRENKIAAIYRDYNPVIKRSRDDESKRIGSLGSPVIMTRKGMEAIANDLIKIQKKQYEEGRFAGSAKDWLAYLVTNQYKLVKPFTPAVPFEDVSETRKERRIERKKGKEKTSGLIAQVVENTGRMVRLQTPNLSRTEVATARKESEKKREIIKQQDATSRILPFDSNQGYAEHLVAGLQGQASPDKKLDSKVKERAEERAAGMLDVIQVTTTGFEKSVEKINERYKVRSHVAVSEDKVLTLEVQIQDGDKLVASESLSLNTTLNKGLESDSKNDIKTIGETLIGPKIWGQITKGKTDKFVFDESTPGNTPLSGLYSNLWRKLKEASAGDLKSEVERMIRERLRKRIDVPISGTSLDQSTANEGLNNGMREYLQHGNALRAQTNIRKARTEEARIQTYIDANEIIKKQNDPVRLTKEGDLEKVEIKRFIDRIYREGLSQKITANFDFITQRFTIPKSKAIIGLHSTSMDSKAFALYLDKFKGKGSPESKDKIVPKTPEDTQGASSAQQTTNTSSTAVGDNESPEKEISIEGQTSYEDDSSR